jgi:hypothetical protein
MPAWLTKTMSTTLYFTLAGARFCPEGQSLLETIEIPALAELEALEDNPYDEHAIGIYLGGTLIGYVPNQGHTCPRCYTDYGKASKTWWCNYCSYQGPFLKTGMASRFRRSFPEGALILIEKFRSKEGTWSARFRLDLLEV